MSTHYATRHQHSDLSNSYDTVIFIIIVLYNDTFSRAGKNALHDDVNWKHISARDNVMMIRGQQLITI